MPPDRGPGPTGLVGRLSERLALRELLAEVRAGRGQVLVVRGEPGIGKTALLDQLASGAPGCRVVRAVGAEAEGELPYAGLHQLCAPLLDGLPELPEPQQVALRTVFGLASGPAPDPLVVGLAMLGLLATAAETVPLLCVVDDVQWLDRASQQALTFVARRLLAEPIGIVFGLRQPSDDRHFAGFPELVLRGLDDTDARELLDSVIPGRIDDEVRSRIIAETRGNPLALMELPRSMSGSQLAGGFGRLDTVALASRIEQSYQRRIAALPEPSQLLLLLAATEPVGDVLLLWAAAASLGIRPTAAEPAQSAELIDIGTRVRFPHPLARAAAYRVAHVSDRRRAHRALADATDPTTDPDRRAWHRASGAAGPDEGAAAELERSAARAQARGGVAAAAAFLERASELTEDGPLRGRRALLAAEAKLAAADPDAASALLATAGLCPLDELESARLLGLRAQVASARRRGNDAPPLLLEAAKRLEPLDAALAREAHLDALGAACFAGRLGSPSIEEVAREARAAPPGPTPPRTVDLLLDGLACRYAEGYTAAVEPLRRALRTVLDDPVEVRWLWLATRIASEVWDDEAWHQLSVRHVELARSTGTLAALPIALAYRAGEHLHSGELGAATALIGEVTTLERTTGSSAPLMYATVLLAAWRGQRHRTTALADLGARDLTERGEGRGLSWVEYAEALIGNGLGDYGAALAAAQAAVAHDDLGLVAWPLVELVEAAARCGRPEEGRPALERLRARSHVCPTDWSLGIEARSAALLGKGSAAEDRYRAAIDHLGRTRVKVHLARAHLVYGEWLRREGRRIDARHHLRTAHDLLAGFGADGFAERARRELLATGETVRPRASLAAPLFTPQERQVAQLAAEGRTNQEIGAHLFISPRTAEYHMRKVFTKLGISSRRQLPAALDAHERSIPAG